MVGTTTPNSSSALDVTSTNKGFLPPRVTLTSTTDVSTIVNPAEGLLIYNLGSNGLQAGYYYWNNANWAIIATSTVAGSGVVASDLVKLYGEVHSSATGKISSPTGYVFTVPVSGRYLFEFNSTATTINGGTNTIYFQVRQGTSVLGSDMQSSYNNNVHVEYNGKVEVNLQAGVSYNVYNYATSGSFESNDYDRVYMKQVSGNLPVNVYPWVLSGNNVYNTTGNVGIGTNAPTSKLDVAGDVSVAGAFNITGSTSANLEIPSLIVGKELGDEEGEIQLSKAGTNTTLTNKVIVDVYRNQLRLWEGGSNSRGVSIDLSKTPDGVGGELLWKKTAFVNAGSFVTLDNLKVTVPTIGNRGLSVCGVASNFTANISAWYGMVGGTAGSAAANVAYTTTPSGSAFGWNFPSEGDGSYYTIIDKTNNRTYRVTLIIGSSFNNNFISIERLY